MRFFGKNISCIRGERLVFSDLNFSIEPGNALIITGNNGSGKTSLLRLMAGLSRPASGHINWQDGAIWDDPETHHIRLHFIGHLTALKSTLSVKENLETWSHLHGGRKKDIVGTIKKLNLEGLEDTHCQNLSAGQKQRASLARLAANDAPLWLLDEPTTALDAMSVDLLNSMIKKHIKGGGICVIATNTGLNVENCLELNMQDFAADPKHGGKIL